MANRADVLVKNMLGEEAGMVCSLSGGPITSECRPALGIEEKMHLPSPEATLIIKVDKGLDLKNCPLTVRSNVDLTVLFSRTESSWTFQIVPNELPAEIPDTVNVTVGDDEPD